jgi:type IV secretory pathway VirB10-like protein
VRHGIKASNFLFRNTCITHQHHKPSTIIETEDIQLSSINTQTHAATVASRLLKTKLPQHNKPPIKANTMPDDNPSPKNGPPPDNPMNIREDIANPPPETLNRPHAAVDAQRAMEHTIGWQPMLNRRQSWSAQDQKRELQMSAIEAVTTGPGFTERPPPGPAAAHH